MSEPLGVNVMPGKGPTVAQFFVESVPATFRSAQEGRPCFDEKEMVRLIIPGDRNNQPVQPVNAEVIDRYPKEYAAFKDGREAPIEGTPLVEWPPISRSQAQEFAYFHIKTVEQLAQVNDAQLQALPMGSRELRAQAIAYVDIANNGTGPIGKMVAENMQLRDENALLKGQIAAARTEIESLRSANASVAA